MEARQRIVHLLDPAVCGAEGVLACASCLAMRDIEQHVWVIGGTDDARLVARLGVPASDRVSMACGLPETAAWSLRTLARARLNDADVAETIIQCWSLPALGLARMVFDDRHRRLGAFVHGPDSGWRTAVGRRRRRYAMKGATAVAMTDDLAALWRGANVRPCPSIDIPPVFAPWLAADREAVRRELRVQPDELAVLLLGDPPDAGDARSAAALLGMMRHTGSRVVGLMHEHSAQFRRAARFVQRFDRHWDLLGFRGSILHAMAAADAVIWDSDFDRAAQVAGMVAGGAILAQAACAAGIPVVAPDNPLTRRVLGEQADACLAEDSRMPALGRKLMPLLDSAERRAQVGSGLARSAEAHMASSRFHQQMRQAWTAAAIGSPLAADTPIAGVTT